MTQLSNLVSQLHTLATIPKAKSGMFFKKGRGPFTKQDLCSDASIPVLHTLAKSVTTYHYPIFKT